MNGPDRGGGIFIAAVLGVLFTALKLCGFIDWSWWWVTAPFWGPFVVVFGLVAGVLVGTCTSGVCSRCIEVWLELFSPQ